MGMPTEGTLAHRTIDHQIRRDVPKCTLNQQLEDVRKAVSSDWTICVVVDPNQIVLGLLDLNAMMDLHGTIEELMKPAPPTLRPSVLIDEASKFLQETNKQFALVTKSSGELIGVFEISHDPSSASSPVKDG
jgi:CBS domain-containing protein